MSRTGTARSTANGNKIRVLGIDPGLTRMGYAVVDEVSGRPSAAACGTVRTPASEDSAVRLMTISDRLSAVLEEWRPEVVAVERLFFSANASSAVGAIQASGVALAVTARHGVEVCEYTPLQVKQAVVGNGVATKKQVQYMVERLLGGNAGWDSPDAADAVAVALTHLACRKLSAIAQLAGKGTR